MTVNEKIEWETISCPVCDGDSFAALFKKNDEPFVICNDCALVLINPRPSYDKIKQIYGNDYSRDYAKKAASKLKRSLRRVRLITKNFVSSGRWLDVGCSAGFVVKVAQDNNFDAFGIDIEPWGINYGKTHLQLKNLTAGTIEEQAYPDKYFNVISLYDVIEHVPNLNVLVKELKRILATTGVIHIITPDIGHRCVTKPLADWKAIKPSEHLYYFNKATLNKLFNKHGLTVVKTQFSFKPSLKAYAQHI